MTLLEPAAASTLIDELLETQRQLTAVERFSRHLERKESRSQQKIYSDLIPLTQPRPGEQFAFVVDLDKCSGCKACVSACHSLNGLDENEMWRSVGLLHSLARDQPFQQHITTACHHCVEPGCADGCPVLAYEKDPVTGIVRHLDDQCIGCQYCVMKCPYEVPRYSTRRGIVRKCDMCANRLAVGEAPACAQACPSEAIRITLVEARSIEGQYRGRDDPERSSSSNQPATRNPQPAISRFLPSSPPPAITLPTTRYKSSRPLSSSLLAGDHAQSRPSDPHLPLVFMLVMTQLAIGTSVAAMFVQTKAYTLASAAAGALAVGIGTLHLGQPLKAWRAFLGWRKSWFSREVIAFGGFVGLASLNAASFWFTPLASFRSTLAIATAGVGVLGVICSAMIYVDTHREFWNARSSFGRFLGTTTLLGTATSVALVVFTPTTSALGLNVLAGLLIFVTVLKLTGEHRIFRHLICEETPVQTPLNKTARLLDGELGLVARSRVACGLLGGLAFPTLILFGGEPIGFAISSFAFCTAGELLERYLFFTAVLPVKMPGAPAPPIARTGAARFRSKSEFRIPQFADSEAASRPRQQGRGVTRRSLPERR